MAADSSKKQAALQLLREGRSVIPVKNKMPLIKWGEFQKRLPTEAEVVGWWTKYPDADIAVICGKVSGNFVVIDIDDLTVAEKVKLAKTFRENSVVKTPSGGLHIRFFDANQDTKCKPLPGVGDLKGEGGYVLVPPSTGYGFETTSVPKTVNNLPQIVSAICSRAEKKVPTPPNAEGIKKEGSPILEGGRNVALASIAGFLRRQGLSATVIEAALTSVNRQACSPPLPPSEITAISKSMERYPAGDFNSDTNKNIVVPKWISAKDLGDQVSEEIDWLWFGFIPRGYLILLSGLPKSGKSTLVSHLIRALLSGDDFLSFSTSFEEQP